MASKIREELVKATGLEPKRGELETAFRVRLILAVQDLAEDKWDALSDQSTDWFNDAGDDINAKNDPRDFPDSVDEPAPETGRRSRNKVASAAPTEPAVGVEVTVTTKRGKTITGKISFMDDDTVVIGKGEAEVELARAGLDIKVVGAATAGGAADEPEDPGEPEVGDTVQVVTKRDKTIMGKVTVLDGDDVVVTDAAGAEHELNKTSLKSLVIKVKGKALAAAAAATAESGRRSRKDKASAAPAAEGGGRANNGAISVGTRIRELVAENMDATEEAIGKLVTKEGLVCKENTLGMAFGDAHRMIKILADRGLIKKK